MLEFMLKPKTASDMAEVATIDGMRRRLDRLSRYDALVRNIFVAAEHRGLSDKDKMTWLAYEALLHREALLESSLWYAEVNPMAPIILK